MATPSKRLEAYLDTRSRGIVSPEDLCTHTSVDLECEDSDTFFVDVKLVYESRQGSQVPIDGTKWLIVWEVSSIPPQYVKKLLFAAPSRLRGRDPNRKPPQGMLVNSVARPFLIEGSGYWNERKLGSTNLEQRRMLEDIAMKTYPSNARGLMTSPQWVEAVLLQAVQKGIFRSTVVGDCLNYAKSSLW
ncbi:hypothetical protein BDY19DRAFT_1015076 [Irpex rosettiformis]|uniref:Uncharacterized protein n=1 Tax=Irpex rosettiformis TaxID=378272 RepID=A0ACB8TY15_9APHY|nr:hypothetical protein BDY19DRAFT_1015076 [Irpex rosettiformis]